MAPPEASWITPEMRLAWWAISGVMGLAAIAIGWAAKTFWTLAKEAKAKAVAEAKEAAAKEAQMTRVLRVVFGDVDTQTPSLPSRCTQAEQVASAAASAAATAAADVTTLKDLLGVSDVNMKRKMVAAKLAIAVSGGHDSGDTFSGVRDHFERRAAEQTGPHQAIRLPELPPPAVEVSRARRPVTGDTTWKGRPDDDADDGE